MIKSKSLIALLLTAAFATVGCSHKTVNNVTPTSPGSAPATTTSSTTTTTDTPAPAPETKSTTTTTTTAPTP